MQGSQNLLRELLFFAPSSAQPHSRVSISAPGLCHARTRKWAIYTCDFHDVILARNVLWESIQHGGERTEQLLKMLCANCGFTVSHAANFCVQCGKGNFLSAYKCTQCTFNYFFPGKFSNHIHGGTKDGLCRKWQVWRNTTHQFLLPTTVLKRK